MVKAFIPGEKYPTLSITGGSCALRCKYCMGHYLKGMISAQSPKLLYDTVRSLYRKGARGILISGGFNPEGRLPINPFLRVIRDLKRDFDIVISVHCGLVDRKAAGELRRAGIDVVDYEFMIDPLVISEVVGLKSRNPSDFIESLRYLVEEGPPYISPHVPIGLRYGKIWGEWKAIERLRDFNPYLVVFLVFVPTRGTPMSSVSPPKETEVVAVLNHARSRFREVAMGCMRPPRFKSTLDPKLLEQKLVDRIAVPHKSVVEKYRLEVVHACCSIPHELIDKYFTD
ncbi:radical SAM protein [Candidatus Bathyarchaeota archaeon]|nr:MAG: radical SAM protein [Candidatus Bathyarchaeota archaeon]